MKKPPSFYDEAHLFVAAIRILEHRQNTPPSLEDVCQFLDCSVEWGGAMSRKLHNLRIINVLEAQFNAKVFIKDHLKLEELPKATEKNGLHQEIEDFKKGKVELTGKVEAIQAELARKKQDLFAELDKKLKNPQG
ncbi:MAG: hypothetical protein A2521_00490 [Deltaproteobacteria bacterium RIFOXYD12_FULL_57_12]|nr:MAG: hypothetical protein A2521_00490 [Deltaproteobacteria bacterium RIFOXYD12_FULL_57_12]